MTVTVELDAYVLPDDHAVYKLFPGKNYRFYEAMYQASAVWLDIRGLDALGDNPAVWEDADVLAIIAADRVARETARLTADAMFQATSGPATDKRNLTFLRGLMRAKKGDLIIVPGKGYRREVLIGEIVDEPGQFRRLAINEEAGPSDFLARAVRWRTMIEKRYLNVELRERLVTPSAFFLIGSTLRDSVYQLAYENYLNAGVFVSTFNTSKERFTSADNLVASVWFNGFAAIRYALENGQSGTVATQPFVMTALLPTGAESQNELQLNINSPGTILVRSVSVFAFALLALLPLSADQAQGVGDGTTRITLHAVGGASDKCALSIEAAVADYVRSLGPERLLEACEFARKARDDATLKGRVHLKLTAEKPT